MSMFANRDLSTIDWTALTPEERTAVTSEALRRARVLRAEFLRELLRGARSWWCAGTRYTAAPRDPVRTRALNFGGRA